MACQECASEFSVLVPSSRCGDCNRELCSSCVVEKIVVPRGKDTVCIWVCDSCFYKLRDDPDASPERLPVPPHRTWHECCLSLLPPGWAEYTPSLLWNSKTQLPVFLEYACFYATVIAAGHHSANWLAAVVVANAVVQVTLYPCSSSLLAAAETAMMRARWKSEVGGAEAKLVSAGALLTAATALVALVWQIAGITLEGLGVSPSVAGEVQTYLRYSLLGVWQEVIGALLGIYAGVLGHGSIVTSTYQLALPAHVVLTVVLVYAMHAGLPGAAIATSLTRTLALGIIAVRLRWLPVASEPVAISAVPTTSPPPSYVAELKSILYFASRPWVGAVLLSVSWQAFVLFVAARLPLSLLVAHAALFFTGVLMLHSATALAQGTSTEISLQFREGKPSAACRVAWLGITLAFVVSTLEGIVLVVLGPALRYLFTHDEHTADLVAQCLPVAVIWEVAVSVVMVCCGVLESTLDHRFMLLIWMSALWLIGIPFTAVLGVAGEGGLLGLWWSGALAQACTAVLLLLRVSRFDWQKKLDQWSEGQGRVGRHDLFGRALGHSVVRDDVSDADSHEGDACDEICDGFLDEALPPHRREVVRAWVLGSLVMSAPLWARAFCEVLVGRAVQGGRSKSDFEGADEEMLRLPCESRDPEFAFGAGLREDREPWPWDEDMEGEGEPQSGAAYSEAYFLSL
mmetsp:Transcript_36149/g.82404  ORF Transcript_36149/g.82404 Transcript_36149/m.82404 type:complete len:685 (-) Transcript_36149:61-2115(-)